MNDTPLEYAEQLHVVQWWRTVGASQWRLPACLLFAVPNGGSRNQIEAKRLQASGVVAGVPDLFLAVGWDGWHGMFIEMKRRKGGRVSRAQAEVQHHLYQRSYVVCTCLGADDAIESINKYLRQLDASGWPGGGGYVPLQTS